MNVKPKSNGSILVQKKYLAVREKNVKLDRDETKPQMILHDFYRVVCFSLTMFQCLTDMNEGVPNIAEHVGCCQLCVCQVT